MKKRAFYKIISILLSIVLLIGAVPTSVIALDEESLDTTAALADGQQGAIVKAVGSLDTLDWIDTIPLQAGEKTLAELQTMTVDLASIPEVINAEHALQKGHVNRLHVQEGSLSTVIYQNQDGTKTTYLFSRPVKYVSADGTVRDKSTVILPILNAAYSHAMLDNSTKVYFGRKADDGTRIDFGSYTINMSPKAENASAAVKNEDGSILYNGVFGARTAVLYKAELNGVKEDIILFSNVGKSSFDFTLSVANATPVQSGGVWSFVNAEGKTVARLDRIWVKDSAGHTTEGSITVTPTEVAGCYDVRVSVAESFLNDASTVYPVYIDPTTTIFEEDYYFAPDGYEYPYDSILDTGLYATEAAEDAAYWHPEYHTLDVDGKIVYKFPNFYGTYLWEGETCHYSYDYNLTADQIGRATLYFQTSGDQTLNIGITHMTDTWDSTDPTVLYDPELWESYAADAQQNYEVAYVADETHRSIDVTAFFREWARYNTFERTSDGTGENPYYNPAHGFVMTASDAGSTYSITAVDDTTSYSNVYVQLDTSYFGGIFCITNPESGASLKNEDRTMDETITYVPTVSNLGTQDLTSNYLWRLEYIGDNQYYIYTSVDNDYMLYAMGSTLSIRELITGSESRYRWTISVGANGGRVIKSSGNRVLRCNGSSLVLSTALSSTDTNYAQTTWIIGAASGYVNMTGFEITSPTDVLLNQTYPIGLAVSPSNAYFSDLGYFAWESSNTGIATVNENGHIVPISSGIVTITLTHKVTGLSDSIEIYVQTKIDDGIYYIMNKESGGFLGVTDGSMTANTLLKSTAFGDASFQKWIVTYDEDGYYTLQALHSNQYMSLLPGETTDDTTIVQTATETANSRWKIVLTASGAHKLVPLNGEAQDLCLAVSYNEIDSIQAEYLEDDFYDDEWSFGRIEHRIDIQIFFDHGYQNSCGNAVGRIEDNLAVVQQKYMEHFGVCVSFSTPTLIYSYADECDSSGDVCEHATDATCIDPSPYSSGPYSCHHTNVKANLAKIRQSMDEPVPFIAFIGQNICHATNHDDLVGLAYFYLWMAGVAGRDDVANETLTTFHEIGHWFGARDHYGGSALTTSQMNQDTNSTLFSEYCVYGEYRWQNEIKNNLTLCDGCRMRVEQDFAEQFS